MQSRYVTLGNTNTLAMDIHCTHMCTFALTSQTQGSSVTPHSLIAETGYGDSACSPCHWCLHLQSHLRHRPSSHPPPPRLSPPLPLYQSGLRHLHGDIHTPPLVSSASLAKERERWRTTGSYHKSINTALNLSLFSGKLLYEPLIFSTSQCPLSSHALHLLFRDLVSTLCLFPMYTRTPLADSCSLPSVKSHRRQSDVSAQSSPAFPAVSQSWS